jgi:hypothetical protein
MVNYAAIAFKKEEKQTNKQKRQTDRQTDRQTLLEGTCTEFQVYVSDEMLQRCW